jgi:hypothetical protein
VRIEHGVESKRIGTRQQLERAIDANVAKVGGDMALAATNLATGETIERDAERSMPTASVFKLPVLVEVFRQAEAGALDLDDRVTLRAEDVVTGSSILRDFGPGLQRILRVHIATDLRQLVGWFQAKRVQGHDFWDLRGGRKVMFSVTRSRNGSSRVRVSPSANSLASAPEKPPHGVTSLRLAVRTELLATLVVFGF